MIRVYDDSEALARAAARDLEGAVRATAEDRNFRLALSGGTTPQRLYDLLAREFRAGIAWTRVEILFADERAVPPDDPASNYGMVKARLLDPLGIDPARVRRMHGEAPDLERAAREYERHLLAPLDLLLLGVGEDAHTASLFPGSPALADHERHALSIVGPKPPRHRLTIGPRVIAEARRVMMLAAGAEKARAVALAMAEDPEVAPAALARHGDWYVDRAAARLLKEARDVPDASGSR